MLLRTLSKPKTGQSTLPPGLAVGELVDGVGVFAVDVEDMAHPANKTVRSMRTAIPVWKRLNIHLLSPHHRASRPFSRPGRQLRQVHGALELL
jgi:hypothetical protein